MPHPSLAEPDARVRAFFDEFSHASDTLDAGVLNRCFADSFLAADPSGVRPVSRELFLQVLPGRKRMFADAGIGPVQLTSLDVQPLDETYLLVRTEWRAPRSEEREPVRLSSTFLLHDDNDTLRIALYLNHRDVGEILRS